MTKQEEIRNIVEGILDECVDDSYRTQQGQSINDIATRILKGEASQGVVIDRTLLDTSGDYAMEFHRYEPLIEVK